MNPIEIKNLVETHISNCKAIIKSEDGRHFDATVISDVFYGKTRVQQQQMVYTVLNQYIADGRIHALSLKTCTPDNGPSENSSGT